MMCPLFLSDLLRKGPSVTGEINLTDDAWQAGNTDGYLAVSGHWIEEVASGVWGS